MSYDVVTGETETDDLKRIADQLERIADFVIPRCGQSRYRDGGSQVCDLDKNHRGGHAWVRARWTGMPQSSRSRVSRERAYHSRALDEGIEIIETLKSPTYDAPSGAHPVFYEGPRTGDARDIYLGAHRAFHVSGFEELVSSHPRWKA